MAATTAKRRTAEEEEEGGGDFHYHYLLRPPLVAIVVNLVVSLTAGLLASPKSERARGEEEEREREGDSCGLAALWGVRGHSNCSRIIIFMAIVISELIAAALRHTHTHADTIGARPLGGATVLKRICTYFRHASLPPPFSIVGWPQQFLTGSSGKCGRQLLGLLIALKSMQC